MDGIVNIIKENPVLLIIIIIMTIVIFTLITDNNKKTKIISRSAPAPSAGQFIDENDFIEQELKNTKFPYYIEKSLLSSKEKQFYKGLKPIADKRNLIILSKMRLADIFKVPQNTYNSIKWFNYIKAKHADFVLCTQDFNPVMLIEIDDKSHYLSNRKDRDKFVNEVCRQAGLKIVHIWNWNGTEGIEQQLFPQKQQQQEKNPSFPADSAG